MSDELHDDEEDPKLKSMRAVWLQMRDEDPPAGGLAELLAAARTQADAMAKPSWWKRVAMLLRRPPVFALATMMIVLGGALLIGRRVEPGQEPTPRLETRGGDEVTAGHATSTEKLPPPPPEAPRQRELPRGPVDHSAERSHPEFAAGECAPPPPKPMQDPSMAEDGVIDGRIKGNAAPRSANDDRSDAQVDTLVEQCETAAKRGDCETVRTMIKRIEKADRSFRKRVAKSSPVAKCLE